MPNLVQSQDAHIATDHSVTRERAIEIQNTVYKNKIRVVRFPNVQDILSPEVDINLFKIHKNRLVTSVLE